MRNIIGLSLMCTTLPTSAGNVALASDIITPEFAAGMAAAIAFFCAISWLHTQRNTFWIGILLAFIETVRVLETSLEATPSVRIALLVRLRGFTNHNRRRTEPDAAPALIRFVLSYK